MIFKKFERDDGSFRILFSVYSITIFAKFLCDSYHEPLLLWFMMAMIIKIIPTITDGTM